MKLCYGGGLSFGVGPNGGGWLKCSVGPGCEVGLSCGVGLICGVGIICGVGPRCDVGPSCDIEPRFWCGARCGVGLSCCMLVWGIVVPCRFSSRSSRRYHVY